MKKLSIITTLAIGFALTAPSHASVILETPTGLNAGDKFRFIFLTSGTTTATSTDIGIYNLFVNTQANGAIYGNSTVTWYALGSTATVDARDNIGGFASDEAVYLVNGTLFANDLTTNASNYGLWSGQALVAPNVGIDGSNLGATAVWTGSQSNGLKGSSSLGTSFPTSGASDSPYFGWWINNLGSPQNASMGMYAVSSQLTVVPEPTSALMSALGATMLLRRRRK